MKKKLLLIIVATTLLTGCGKTIPKLENGEEAIVTLKDGTKISINEVWEDLKDSYAMSLILEKVDNKILSEKYKSEEETTEQYVKGVESSLKASYPDEEKLEVLLQQNGFTGIEDYLNQQKTSYLQQKAYEDYAKSLVTEKEINNYYKNEAVGDIHCVHILVKPDGSTSSDDEKAKKKAEEIISAIKKEIKSGKKALDVFKSYESDTSVTYQDLDYFNKGDMVEQFEKAAYALKKNEMSSKPVKTSYGYHIILKVDEKEKGKLEDIKDSIIEKLGNEKLSNDSTKIQTEAMVELRKEYGFEWYDSDLESSYKKYINYLLNN